MGYSHLTIDERESILKMRSEQKDMTHIAELIGRDKGTISRELSRNRCSTGGVFYVYNKFAIVFFPIHLDLSQRCSCCTSGPIKLAQSGTDLKFFATRWGFE